MGYKSWIYYGIFMDIHGFFLRSTKFYPTPAPFQSRSFPATAAANEAVAVKWPLLGFSIRKWSQVSRRHQSTEYDPYWLFNIAMV